MIITSAYCFCHLQKCSGSFVERFLLDNFPDAKSVFPKHRGISTIPNDITKDKLKFGVIRNPFDWYISWWSANNPEGKGHLFPKIFNQENKEDFNKFIKYIMTEDFGKQHDIDGDIIRNLDIGIYTYRYLKAFCIDDIEKALELHPDGILVDQILHMETLRSGLSAILRLNKEKKKILDNMNRVHTSKHGYFMDYYNEESIELVKNKDRLIYGRHYEELDC